MLRRREFITLLGGAAATWPIAARGQQSAMPVIGFLNGASPAGSAPMVASFHQGLKEAGYVEAQNVTIEYRWADGRYGRLPAMATDLVRRQVAESASSFGVEVVPVAVNNAAEIERSLEEFAGEPDGGLIVSTSPIASIHSNLIIGLAARRGISAVYPFRFYASDGGLISFGIDSADLFRRAAFYVDRILRGEKTAELPVQAPTKFELVINAKTAKALGLEIPPTLLARADEVIE
jgi:ABC-type uncharacterized transport system substrate-binding protein